MSVPSVMMRRAARISGRAALLQTWDDPRQGGLAGVVVGFSSGGSS